MERVGQILRVLFRRALAEHPRQAPALFDIIIESAAEPRVGAVFANGYRTWAPLPPNACMAFCERHAVWDLESCRRAMLREGEIIYARMLREHAEREQDRRAWFAQQMRRLGWGLQNFRQPRAAPRLGRIAGDWPPLDDGTEEAQQRGIKLLKENLSPAQLKQYEKHWHFEVIGGKTGKRYRIRHGRSMNIDQLDKNGRRFCGWCFYPRGCLVAGDVMLAQKLALELFELDALKVANRMW